MQNVIRQTRSSDHIFKEQVCILLCGELSLPHKARHKSHISKDTHNASHNSIETIAKGQVGCKVNGPTPRPPATDWQWVQQTIRCLGTILGILADLSRSTNLLTAVTYVWLPHTCIQQLMHRFGTKVGRSMLQWDSSNNSYLHVAGTTSLAAYPVP